MSEIPFFLRFATILFLFSSSSSADQRLHSRHLLHLPFFPITTAAPPPSSEPPSPSPHSHHHHHKNHQETPPPHEKHPFSSASNPPPPPPPPPPPSPLHPNTFFPSADPSSPTSHPPPSPPPPHRASLPTFPANISSLVFPTHNKPHNNNNRHVAKLLAITIAIVLSLLAVVTIFLRRTRHHRRASAADDAKSTKTDSRQLFNAAPSDGSSLKHKQPPKYTSSNTSSEFLYLGTLVNSGLADQQKSPGSVAGVLELPPPAQASSSSSSSSSDSQYQKLGSPELRPLPPLPKLPVYTPNYRSTELLNPKGQDFDVDDNENDEFYSPRGSPGRKQQSPPRVWAVKASNSGSVSSSNGSPAKSLKPKSSLSPRLSLNSSNGSVSKRPVPTRPPPPPPPPAPQQVYDVPATTTTSLSPPSDSDMKEETLKPKLKPLHWDKVRASSSRVTVWDQIKSNSFQ